MDNKFDDFAETYRRVHDESIKISGADSDYFSEHKVLEVKRTEGADGVRNILDVGCGDGNSARFFREHFPHSKIYGVDVSRKSIDIARSRNLPDCFFSAYGGEKLPFMNGIFDLVFIAGVLHHIDRQEHANILNESSRVLKNGGHLFIFEHNPFNPITRKVVKDCIFDQGAVLLPSKYLHGLVKKAGFKNIKTRYTIFFPRFSILKKLACLENYLWWLPIGGQYYVCCNK